MTSVVVTRQKKHITKLVCDGHTGYGVQGEDIVCAALSSIVQTALLGLLQVCGIEVDYQRNDKKGFLSLELDDLQEHKRHDADIVLDTMLCGILDLYETYSDFIELQIKDN
ncbi:MAG: ribosomal-processing cysteine protease Prp [Firmicutes bacterium]|nr:ribosomal-processing cysteine protease Prp [Bacillota bacterium]